MLKALALCAILFIPSLARADSPRKNSPPSYEEDYEDANVQSTGGIIRFGENISVMEGEQVDGPVIAVGGSAKIEGTVNGPVISLGGSTELGPHSEVNGAAVSIGGRTARSPGSRIDGPIVDTPGSRFFGGLSALAAYLAVASISLVALTKISASLGWIIIALVLTALFPKNIRVTKDALERRALASVLAGLVFWPCLFIAVITLLMSLIGIPLIPLLFLTAAASYVWGITALGYAVGLRFTKNRWDNPLISVGLGMLILKILQWLPLLSWAMIALFGVVGVGAAVLSRFGWQSKNAD